MKRWLLVGFLAGAAAVLVFHQGAVALLHLAGLTPRTPFSFAPTQPWGVPQIWSIAFWGGAWGIVLAALLGRLDRVAVVGASLLFGAIFPTAVAWFIVAPLEGQPIAAGLVPAAMLVGPLVNAAWGLGTGLGLALFGRVERRHRVQSVPHERRRDVALGGFPR